MSEAYSSSPPFPTQSGVSRTIAWIIVLGLIGYVFWGVNLSPEGRRSLMQSHGRGGHEDAQFRVAARLAVGNKMLQENISPGPVAREVRLTLMRSVDTAAHSARERLAAAIVAGEIVDLHEALRRIERLRERHLPSLRRDLDLVQRIYSNNHPAKKISSADRVKLKKDLGWSGSLALVHNLPADDPARAAVLAPAQRAMNVTLIMVFVVGLAALAGFIMLITGIALFAAGKMHAHYAPVILSSRTDRPAPAVFLEAFAVYLLLYVGLGELISRIAPHVHAPKIIWYAIIFSSLPIALAWPVWRGAVGWRELFVYLGWHRGASGSAILEMFLGVVGYISCLPIIAAGFFITLAITRFTHIDASHPIIEQLSGSRWQLLAIFLLACVWAPVAEETMFRGALFNHLRGRPNWWGRWIPASIIVGVLFAAVHPQGWTAIPVLGSVGMSLAWIRQWRGSIIGSMTAHALNNGTVLALAIALLR